MKNQNEFSWADMELRCILRTLIRNLWMIVLAALTFAMGARALLNATYEPAYTSSITFAVTSKSATSSSYSNMSKANEVAELFSDLLESNLMKKEICSALGEQSLPGTVTAEVQGTTNILVVSATAPSAREAFVMITAVKENYSTLSSHIVDSAVLQVLAEATVPTSPSNYRNNNRLSMIVGILGAFAMAAFLVYYSILRDTIQTQTGARHKLDATVLVSVPHEKRGWKTKHAPLLICNKMVSFFFEETFFRLRNYVETAGEKLGSGKTDAVTVLVTSVVPGEGKSTVAANLALALAQKHKAVMLIDADLRNPTQVRLFGEAAVRNGGLSKLLDGEAPTMRRIVEATSFDKEKNLVMLLDNGGVENASELLSSPRMKDVIRLMRQKMDYIIIDSPPMGLFADGNAMADLADLTMLVVRQDMAAAADINDTVDTLNQSHSKFIGCVLNDMRSLAGGLLGSGLGYGYGYGYGYGSKYGSKYGYGYGQDQSKDRKRS